MTTAYASAKTIEASAIPIIDIGALRNGQDLHGVGQQLLLASQSVGFFYIRNHAVPDSVIARARAAAKRFFACSMADKNEVRVNASHRGFLAAGQAKMYDNARTDLKESFVWGLQLDEADPRFGSNAFLAANQWPACDPQLQDDVYPYLSHCNDCGKDLFKAFAAALNLPTDAFIQHFDAPISRASMVYYPPQSPDLGDTKFGVGPHTDFGCLTLLCQDDVGGLQVETNQGEWVTAHPIDGTLVVNIGDLLQRWSNNKLRSTPHRVVNTSGRERYSLVAAVDPNYETIIDPAIVCADPREALYPPISCGDALQQRFSRAFKYRQQAV
jgi:isopenicillin N synthase-like dioxygenase